MLNGKVALVTGSTSGIGLAIASGLAEAGASVMLNGIRDVEHVERIRRNIEISSGSTVRYAKADMLKPLEITALVAEVHYEFGSLDILVNCAGVQSVSPIEDFDDADWDRVLAVNLSSAFHAIKAALPGMRQRKWGRIINIASAHGLVASPFKSAYVAAKHGLVGLTKCVALEAAETNITCNAVCPGYVRTPLVEGQIASQAKAHGMTEESVVRDVILASQPNKRFIEPKELSDLCLFLASPGGASITGASLAVDGGWTAR